MDDALIKRMTGLNARMLVQQAFGLFGFPAAASNQQEVTDRVECAKDMRIDYSDVQFSYPSSFYADLLWEIEENKGNIGFWMRKTLSQFSDIAGMINPRSSTRNSAEHVQSATLKHTQINSTPFAPLLSAWREYEIIALHLDYPGADKKNKDLLDSALETRKSLYSAYFATTTCTYVNILLERIRAFAYMLEAALLEAQVAKDLFDFQREAGVMLVEEIQDSEMRSYALGMSTNKLNMLRKERQSLNGDVPQLTVLDRFREQLDEYAHCRLWIESGKLYSDVIAADKSSAQIYLWRKRSAFFNSISNDFRPEVQLTIQTVYHRLLPFWSDAKERLHIYDCHPLPDDMYKAVLDVYQDEILSYISTAYYYSLLRPVQSRYDIQALFPGIDKGLLKRKLYELFHLDSETFDRHEADILPISTPAPVAPSPMKPTKGKRYEANEAFDSPEAELIYGKLKKKPHIKVEGKNYRWVGNDAESLSYLCHKLSAYLLGDDAQIENALFCQKIQSNTKTDTVGRYARKYREGTKKISAAKRKEIDDLFK